MAVCVEFPNGFRRDVPSQLRPLSEPLGGAPEYEQVPLNCDPCWRYERVGSRWIAVRRHAAVTTLQQPVAEWWRSIEQMREPASPPLTLRHGPGDDDAGALRPAA